MALVEYVPTSHPDFSRINNLVRNNGYPDACIVYIQRVLLPEEREIRFRERCQSRGAQGRILEVFHGTNANNLHSIIHDGFKAACNRTSAYGIGTYASPKANTSIMYAPPSSEASLPYNFVLVCNLFYGNAVLGTSGASIDTSRYDVAVNDLTNPTIMVTPHDDGIMPRFLVAFYARAPR